MDGQLLSKLYDVLNSQGTIKDQIITVEYIRKQMELNITDEERINITHMIQSRVQDEAITAFKLNKYFGCVYMATGTGKSRVAIKMSEQIVKHEGSPRVLLVVPTENLRDEGWKEEFKKWGHEEIWKNNVVACCYASLNKYKGETFDLVILDEGHHLTPNNAEFFSNNIVRACVFLTATPPTNQDKVLLLRRLGLEPVYILTLDESVRLGLIIPYDITIITMGLNKTDKYIKSGTAKKPFMSTEESTYQYMSRRIIKAPTKMAYLHRMRFIYNLRSKTETAKLILQHVIPPELRTIIFCGSIDQANEVCEDRFHSKTTTMGMSRFRAGIINKISCVNSINEGQNIPALDVGFIVQLNSQQLHLFQRLGRFLRYRPGKSGKIIILITNDTVEVSWLERAMSEVDQSRVEVIKLEDLRSGAKKITFNN